MGSDFSFGNAPASNVTLT